MTEEYKILTVDTVAKYLADHPEAAKHIDVSNIVESSEIGDGNLNLVFRVVDGSGGSLIVKQSLPYVRMTGEGWPMTPTRAQKEAHSLMVHGGLVPELVVNVFDYDEDNFTLVMEDLSDHEVWRGALNKGVVTNGVARPLGEYVANVAVQTSVLGRDRGEVAAEIADTQNPELCTITEDLVFTEPVHDAGRNSVLPENEVDARELSTDPAFSQAMAVAKWKFMTEAQALIHGDLHTGSVMVKVDGDQAVSIKVFDSEFAFYGPVGFDLGALLANYTLAAARAHALGDGAGTERLLAMIKETWTGFRETFVELAKNNQSPDLWGPKFVAWLCDTYFSDMLLFGSAKLARRIVGAAKVTDIETLEPELREKAARGALKAARYLAAEYRRADDVDQVIAGIQEALI